MLRSKTTFGWLSSADALDFDRRVGELPDPGMLRNTHLPEVNVAQSDFLKWSREAVSLESIMHRNDLRKPQNVMCDMAKHPERYQHLRYRR